jgi:hypothetical protein
MDPQDLLYTNVFVDQNVISKEELDATRTNYGRFRDYIGSREKETNQYIDENAKESDPFNISKTLQEPFPTNLKKNHYPLFDSYIKDISQNRYQKERVTKMSLNSADRNKTLYLYPDSFSIPLNRVFNNVQEIRLSDLVFPNSVPPINNYNNALSWQYASVALLQTNLIDDNIIPVPISTKTINYSSLPNAVSDIPIQNSNYLVYQSFVPEGFYTTNTLPDSIRTTTGRICHGMTYINQYANSQRDNSVIQPDIHPFDFPYEEPYYSSKQGLNTPTLWNFTINPINSVVYAVNRMEELDILAIQTFEEDVTSGELSEYDVFNPYVTSTVNNFDPNYIYITVKQGKQTSTQWYGEANGTINPFPLVLTDLTGIIGGIPAELLNYTEFWDVNIYEENGYPENSLNSISTYKLYDKIQFTDKYNVKHNYLRFALKLSTGNANGRRSTGYGAFVILPKNSCTIIYNNSLDVSLLNGQVDGGYFGEAIQSERGTYPKGGRTLLCRFIFDITNNGQYVDYEIDTANMKKRSFLSSTLCFPVAKVANQTILIEQKPTFSFVHTNTDSIETTSDITQLLKSGLPYFYRSPLNKLNLQIYNGEYYFKGVDFIFLRISPTGTPLSYSNMTLAIDNKNQQLNQNYVDNTLMNIGIGTDYQCLPSSQRNQMAISKNYTNIFGKILLSPLPMNTETNQIINTNFAKLYNQPIDNLTELTIQILLPDMVIYNMGRDFSFTLEIVEIIDLLKETNIDTKRDNVVTTGYRPY